MRSTQFVSRIFCDGLVFCVLFWLGIGVHAPCSLASFVAAAALAALPAASALGSWLSAFCSWLSAAASPTRVAPLCCLACFRRAAFRCCRFAIFFHRVAADCVDSRRAVWALCSRVDFRRAASEDRRIVDRKLQSSLPCWEVGSATDPRLGIGLVNIDALLGSGRGR